MLVDSFPPIGQGPQFVRTNHQTEILPFKTVFKEPREYKNQPLFLNERAGQFTVHITKIPDQFVAFHQF